MNHDMIGLYTGARTFLAANPDAVISIERQYCTLLGDAIRQHTEEIFTAINDALPLFPFWVHHPPQQRGRKPVGDSTPWIEVGEKPLIGYVLKHFEAVRDDVRYPGLPTGADVRLMTDDALLHIDIKMTGPRDKREEVVASPNQISGDGLWDGAGVRNSEQPIASRSPVPFRFVPELPPLYIYNGTPRLCVTLFLKCVYRIHEHSGVPRVTMIDLLCVPNGLLAFVNPRYTSTVSRLFTRGKDDQTKLKKRIRVNSGSLASIGAWRVETFLQQA